MNRVQLVGRLARDPELKQTQSGTPVCRFTVAVDRRYQKDGQKKADFISCIAWSGTAEFVSRWFTKGKLIGLSGRIETGSYEKEGTKIYTTDVIAEDVEFVGGRNESGGQAAPTAPSVSVPHVAPETPVEEPDFVPMDDTELPF